MRRGALLGSVLMVLSLVMVAAFCVAATAMCSLSGAAHNVTALTARNLADSAAAAAAERLLRDPTFGTHGGDGVSLAADAGRVIFDDTQTHAAWSTSNYDPGAVAPIPAKSGYDSLPVPPQTVLLIGNGQSDGVSSRAAVLLALPPFPYAVATAGNLAAPSGVLVAALPPGASDQATIDLTHLLPANAASNAASAQALSLGRGSRVSGDVHAVGGVVLSAGSIVNGSVISPAAPAPLPRLRAQRVLPAGSAVGVGSSANAGDMHVSGYSNAGALQVQGDLWLDNAVLYVDGDLNVSGGLRGIGAVVVNGGTTLGGASSLQANEQAALIALGGATIQSNGATSFFHGVLYSEGPLVARHVVLNGALVANAPSGGGTAPDVTLQDTTLLQNGAYQSFTMPLAQPPQISGGRGVTGPPTLTPQSYGFDEGMGSAVGGVSLVYNGQAGWATYKTPGGWSFDPSKIDAKVNICVPQTTDPTQHVVLSLPISDVQMALQSPAATAALMQQMQSAVASHQAGPLPANVLGEIQSNLDVSLLWNRYQTYLASLQTTLRNWPPPGTPTGGNPGPTTGPYHFDLNEFLGLADRWRVQMWRSL